MWDVLTTELFSAAALGAFAQVVMIDLVLAGDNAVVIGLAAAGLPADQRPKAILIGIGAATLLRIGFAGITTQLLDIVGLLLAGGLLLLWVCWKMWRELRADAAAAEDHAETHATDAAPPAGAKPRKTFVQAAWQIVVADVSMSLDNVLAVAGAAREHPIVLVFGLMLSIALMGIAANFIAKLLNRHRWIAYVGLAVILYVALEMIWRGALEVWPVVAAPLAAATGS
ncbi:TerC family protein [Rhodovulum sp. PH10]|uniref:TerC family protein n=1 Tax=Rhodovulum sp. PH10 TaxID=1187851 RepID=UPI00058E2BC7|nr:TerC family protein [Rhodovulum sp. PH10]